MTKHYIHFLSKTDVQRRYRLYLLQTIEVGEGYGEICGTTIMTPMFILSDGAEWQIFSMNHLTWRKTLRRSLYDSMLPRTDSIVTVFSHGDDSYNSSRWCWAELNATQWRLTDNLDNLYSTMQRKSLSCCRGTARCNKRQRNSWKWTARWAPSLILDLLTLNIFYKIFVFN